MYTYCWVGQIEKTGCGHFCATRLFVVVDDQPLREPTLSGAGAAVSNML
jgi:hypothetical protein